MEAELVDSPVLFIGNSPNQVHGVGQSWSDLLASLRTSASMTLDAKAHELKPFPLHFEEIRNRYLAANPTQADIDVVSKVVELFGKMKPNKIHAQLMRLAFSEVVTTNYDDCLERAMDVPSMPANFGIKERAYSLFRRVAVGGKHVWHVHGDVSTPQSIVLGHDRYVESCAQMKRYMDLEGLKFARMDPVKAVFKQSDSIDLSKVHSWIDLFLTRDVHIVGFGLDFTEVDIWYLLSYRARHHKTGSKWISRLSDSKVFAHMFVDPTKQREMQKIEVLRSFGVDVLEYSIAGSSYEEQWQKVLTALQSVV